MSPDRRSQPMNEGNNRKSSGTPEIRGNSLPAPPGPRSEVRPPKPDLPSEPAANIITAVSFSAEVQAGLGRAPEPFLGLLHRIGALRASIGDDLNDDELTHLILAERIPSEAGFAFIYYSQGNVTLSVPRQNTASWYPDKGWIAAEKESLARVLAGKYGLTVCEPPDMSARFSTAPLESGAIHHHLAFFNRWETIIVAHPHYLKVRLFGRTPPQRAGWEGQVPIPLGPELLQDLAALYRG